MRATPATNSVTATQGLLVFTDSFLRPAPMSSMSCVCATTRRLNSSVSTNMTPRHPTVSVSAGTEKKKWKFEICVLNMDAVKNVMTHETPTPSASPNASAPPETMAHSTAMTRATRPRVMPSTWYRPNSFLRRRMMKLLAYTMRNPMTPARKYVSPPSVLPRSSARPSSATPAMSACMETVLNA